EHLSGLAVHVVYRFRDLPGADRLLTGRETCLGGDPLDMADRLLRLLRCADLLVRGEGDLVHQLPCPTRGGDDLLQRRARLVSELNALLSSLRDIARGTDGLAHILEDAIDRDADLAGRFHRALGEAPDLLRHHGESAAVFARAGSLDGS